MLDPKNQFVFPILRAESTTVSVFRAKDSKDTKIAEESGELLTLVSGYQTRYNNRGALSGSVQMCSDDVIAANESNEQFCKQLASWVFQESGVLRASNLRHNKKGEICPAGKECPNPENYKIEDHVEFYIDLEQKTNGVWQPFFAEDIQLQFIMLEPYYSVMLDREAFSSSVATYSYKFRVPQRLGIFRFVVEYSRYGLTFLDEQCEVSVIQWRHDAFPRYLTRAFPFYASVFTLMAAFFIFISYFLFSSFPQTKVSSKGRRDE